MNRIVLVKSFNKKTTREKQSLLPLKNDTYLFPSVKQVQQEAIGGSDRIGSDKIGKDVSCQFSPNDNFVKDN